MSEIMTRRKALSEGISSAGIIVGTSCSKPQQEKPSKASSHPPFLSPWSPPTDLKRDLIPGRMTVRLASWSSQTTLDYRRDNGLSITDMVKRIRDMGYTSGNANIKRSIWHSATESEIKELREALKQYDVTFFDMHTTGSNIHPDLTERQKVFRYTIESCEAAESVGCPMVTTHTGSAGYERAFSAYKDNWTNETWKLSVKVMKQILKDTAGMKVALGVEATNMTAMNNPRAHLQLIEEIADPRLKVCLDPVNMINLGTYFRTTELIEECFDFVGPGPRPPRICEGQKLVDVSRTAIRVMDITRREAPSLVNVLEVGAGASILALATPHLLSLGDSLSIVGITVPQRPSILGQVAIHGSALAVAGDLVHVVGGKYTVIDITDPTHPIVTPVPPRFKSGVGILVAAGYSFLAGRHDGIHVYGLNDPGHPRFIRTIRPVDPAYNLTSLHDDLLFFPMGYGFGVIEQASLRILLAEVASPNAE